MKTLRVASWLLSAVVLLGGCHIGPKWEEPIELPTLLGSADGKRVIVGRYMETHSTSSITRSAEIEQLRESVRVHDNSMQLAMVLRAAGVDVEAREGVETSDLEADELLVRGGVIASPYIVAPAAWLTFTFTVTIVGGILPSPFAFTNGAHITYFVEVVDSNGRWLMQTGDERAIGYFESYYVWGAMRSPLAEVAELATEEIGKQLAERLR